MLKDLLINGYGKEQGYNCAEKVLYGANEAYNLGFDKDSIKAVAGFGGGMGIGSVCGALTAGTMVLSKLFVKDIAKNSKIRELTSEFLNRYKKEMEEINCAPLKKEYRNKTDGCDNIIIKASEILDDIVSREVKEGEKDI